MRYLSGAFRAGDEFSLSALSPQLQWAGPSVGAVDRRTSAPNPDTPSTPNCRQATLQFVIPTLLVHTTQQDATMPRVPAVLALAPFQSQTAGLDR